MQKVIRRFENSRRKRQFNCGGFALGTYDWYRPQSWDYIYEDDYEDEEKYAQAFDEMVTNCTDDILENFSGQIRLIKREEDAKRGEVVVFFRLADDDFHFVLKSGNKYFQKRGGTPCLEETTKEEVYSNEWNDRYNSRIVIFARKKYLRYSE